MICTKQKFNLHNRFDLQLIDSRTGEVKQEAQAENVVLNQFLDYLNAHYSVLNNIALGTGTGTPSVSDTALFAPSIYSNNVPYERVQRTLAMPTSTLSGAFTFPATSSYVGTFTEIGVYSGNSRSSNYLLITHAMLADSEGNPITITKTDLDILVVTVTMYLTLEYSDPSFIPDTSKSIWSTFTDRAGSGGIATSGGLLLYPDVNSTNANSNTAISLSSTGTWSTSEHTLTRVSSRLGTDSGNTHYINGIGIGGHGWIRLPNANVFSPYTLQALEVGVGDGSTTDFSCPVPAFIKNSDVVYKNGVAMSRGVDYTIDNINNGMSLPELSQFAFAELTPGSTREEAWGSGEFSENTVYSALTKQIIANNYTRRYCANMSYVVHLKEPDVLMGNKINTIVFDEFVFGLQFGTYSYKAYGSFKFNFEYSIDGEVWNDLCTVSGSLTSSSSSTYSGQVSFNAVEANYIRISLLQDGTDLKYMSGYYPQDLVYPYEGCTMELHKIRAMYIGNPIRFTTAPAEGDVITMDARLDRPFKSSNSVMEASMSIKIN